MIFQIKTQVQVREILQTEHKNSVQYSNEIFKI